MAEHPEAEDLEKKISEARPGNSGTAHEKKENSKGTLESVANELGDLLNLGVGIAAPAAGYALTGNLGVPVVSAAYVAGSSGNLTSKGFRNESLIGSIVGTILNYFTLPLKTMALAGKAAYLTMTPLVTNLISPTTDHLVKNKSPRGLYEKLRKDYWPNVKKTFRTSWPIGYFPSLFLPQAYVVAAMGIAFYVYKKFVVGSKGEETDKTPYSVAAPNVSYKLLRNTSKGLYDATTALGSGISKLLYSPSSKAGTKQAPNAAGGHP